MNEQMPDIAVKFIDSVIKRMRYRRKVRQEVRRELEAHFEDGLRDCRDEEDKRKRTDELIEGFGQPKLLARLIRRGKKRCRPMYVKALLGTVKAFGIFFLAMVLYIVWFFSGKPVITTNYMEVMNERVKPVVADENLNAWPMYKKAAESYVKPSDEKFDTRFANLSDLTEEQRRILDKWIADNQTAVDYVLQGNQKPHYWQQYSGSSDEPAEMLSMLIPNLSDYRNIASILVALAKVKAEKGDFNGAFGDLLEVFDFGVHLRGQNTTLIEQLVAIAIKNRSAESIRLLVQKYPVDTELLRKTRQRFEQLTPKDSYTVDFESEKLFLLDEIQRSFVVSRIGKSHLYIKRLSRLGLALSAGEREMYSSAGAVFRILFTHPDKEETIKSVECFYSFMGKLSQMSPAKQKAGGMSADEEVEKIAKGNMVIGWLLPALDKVTALSFRDRIGCEATLTVLALKLYQQDKGSLPEDIEQLVKDGYISSVPVDPYSDKPLIYKKVGQDFTLYSVGTDFEDDGGTVGKDKNGNVKMWETDGDAVFWPVEN